MAKPKQRNRNRPQQRRPQSPPPPSPPSEPHDEASAPDAIEEASAPAPFPSSSPSPSRSPSPSPSPLSISVELVTADDTLSPRVRLTVEPLEPTDEPYITVSTGGNDYDRAGQIASAIARAAQYLARDAVHQKALAEEREYQERAANANKRAPR